MSNANDDLRKRILEDNDISAPAGDAWRAALVSRFDAKRKKLIIYATVQLLMGLAILFAGAALLNHAGTLKLMFLATVVMLIGYETTVLVKLWYWVADTNARVTRELKQLQLIAAGDPTSEVASPTPAESADVTAGWNRISMRSLHWLSIAIIMAASVIGALAFLRPLGSSTATATREEHAQIDADGGCTILARDYHHYAGVSPLESVQIRSKVALDNPNWQLEGMGRLPYTTSQDNQVHLYTVRLPQPVFRGEQVDLRTSARADTLVSHQGNQWTYQADWDWCHPRPPALTINPEPYQPMTKTVTLPLGAIIESVCPQPRMQWAEYDGRPVLSFEAPSTDLQPPAIRVCYRLPEMATTQPALDRH